MWLPVNRGLPNERVTEYRKIPSTDDLRTLGQDEPAYTGPYRFLFTITLALLVVSNSITYFVTNLPEYRSGLLAPSGSANLDFVYNDTFSRAPTEQTTTAWNNLFPKNGGFIHHPNLAQNFSGIAVFHQLHCLHTLYNLYYGVEHKHGGQTSRSSSAHARHCFDYLRQSLMCQADTNLEPYDYRLDGVTGWGRKMCRDYDEIVRFANSWGGSKYLDDSIK